MSEPTMMKIGNDNHFDKDSIAAFADALSSIMERGEEAGVEQATIQTALRAYENFASNEGHTISGCHFETTNSQSTKKMEDCEYAGN